MKTIYINGKFLSQKITGVQRVARELVFRLDKLAAGQDQLSFVLLVPDDYDHSFVLSFIKTEIIHGNGGYAWEQIKLPRYLKKKKDYFLLSLCNISPLALKRKNLVTMHDLAVVIHPEFFSKKFVLIYRYIFKKQAKFSPLIFTDSLASKNGIVSYYKADEKKVRIIWPASFDIDAPVAQTKGLENALDGRACFSVGSASPNKNIKYVIACARKNPQYTFLLSGGKSKAFAKNEGVDEMPENVHYLGYLSDDELRYVYSKCEFFLFPSIYEGFGLPPLEAATYGCKKIIVSDIPTMHEVFGDDVNYVNPLDYENVVNLDAVREYDYTNLRSKFSWDDSAKKLLDCLIEVAK